MVLARLGRIEDKFFRLIPKALAFKPIDDIKDFVYSYVLDEKEVNIDVLRENVRTYQDLERTLESVKKRISKLEQIEKHHEEVLDCERKDHMYEYFLQQAQLDITKENIQNIENQIRSEEYRLKEIQSTLDQLKREWASKQEIETSLRVELKQNKDFIALEEQKKEKERLQAEEKNCLKEKKELMRSVAKASDHVAKLLEVSDVDGCIRGYGDSLKQVEKLPDIAEMKKLTDQVIKYKNTMYGKIQRKIAEIQVEINSRRQEREELNKQIDRLERKKLTYPDGVERVMAAVKEEFTRIGRKAEPYVLCELLEIKEEQWRNAVEGYLNTQRFYILVEPESFDIALGIYDRLRREKKAYGVGLINTQNMEKYEEASQGTLASVVTSKNKYARRYINMVLGKVQMCDRYEDLKKYPTSITRECMRYQNRVASAIKPEIFSVPFIGSHAFKVQLEQAKRKRNLLNETIDGREKHLSDMESVFGPLNTEADVDIKYRLDVISSLRRICQEIKICEDNIRTLKKNATLIQKQIQLEALEKLVQELHDKIEQNNQRIGTIREKTNEKKERRESLQLEQMQIQQKVDELAAAAGDVLPLWLKEYEGQTAQKSYEQFLAKLQENMKQAQGEFRELNRALKDIVFSNERYEFLFMPSRRYRSYYEMIMDDFNVIQGESIFSGVFHENHKEVIEELFERLALNNESSTKTLEEFTDYRTYMDYDIKIMHTDGTFSYYSKVCEEKSGGETQTPFYVTVAASFVQLYTNNIGGEAAGLVMFDEAFNNMDDERIGGVLEFLNRLPLQLLIAAPPDKIQYIGPSMEETLLVMTDEKVSFVEEYYHEV